MSMPLGSDLCAAPAEDCAENGTESSSLLSKEQRRKSRLHNQFGSFLQRASQFEKAIDHFRKALFIDPEFAAAHHNLATCLAKVRNVDDAISHFEQAVCLNPKLADSYTNLAVMYLLKDRIELAKDCCLKAIELDPNGCEAHFNLNNALRQLGRKEEAIDHVWNQVAKLAGTTFTRPQVIQCNKEGTPKHGGTVEHISVVCVKWGTKYGPEYVNKLYRGVCKHLSLPFTFYCYTEDPTGLDDPINIRSLVSGWTGWWGKASLFSTEKSQLSGRVMYIDLDTVITGSLDDIVQYQGQLAILGTDNFACETARGGYNSSVLLWEAGFAESIFDVLQSSFSHISRFIVRYDHWLEMMVQDADIVQDVFPGQVVEYKHDCTDNLPPSARIVCFPRDPKPHEHPSEWIRHHWI